MSILVLSTSLHPQSRSRVMARCAAARLGSTGQFMDLQDHSLPMCDGAAAYGHAGVGPFAAAIAAADGVILAFPVYNFNAGAAVKNLIELTGSAWENKVVGLMCAAGGRNGFMAPMALANSLMLDFRCLILPRFVFVEERSFNSGALDIETTSRIDRLVDEVVRVAAALTAK